MLDRHIDLFLIKHRLSCTKMLKGFLFAEGYILGKREVVR